MALQYASSHLLRKNQGAPVFCDRNRVILKRFFPSSLAVAARILRGVLAVDVADASKEVAAIVEWWFDRHNNIESVLRERYTEILEMIGDSVAGEGGDGSALSAAELAAAKELPPCKQQLLASYFLHEYAIEAAALFNPSIVPHPTLPDTMIVSFRACGEGHISSIVFRTCTVTDGGRMVLGPNAMSNLVTGTQIALDAAGNPVTDNTAHGNVGKRFRNPVTGHEFALPEVDYMVKFEPASEISQRVLFPATGRESNGIEDARFVRFVDDDGTATYYATYTAYNGKAIQPQLIETTDFTTFKIRSLAGQIENKGVALFPRKVKGQYIMLSRQDDQHVLLMKSDSLYSWADPQVIVRPEAPWELYKMGNCGSPIETPEGWVVLTHGVGPLRRYCIGAVLLDLDAPERVIGRLKEPLISPGEGEREGYVPNVVYTCGALLHKQNIVIPYATSDSCCSFASVDKNALVQAMLAGSSRL